MRLSLRSRAERQDGAVAHGPCAGAQPHGTDASVRCTVHREPVVTLDGRLVGHSVNLTLAERAPAALGSVPATVRGCVVTADDDALHELYLGVDLPRLVADRYVFLPATRAMLDGHVPVPLTPGRLVLDLPLGFEAAEDAVERAAALGALGLRLALLDYHGTAEQEAVLRHVSFVVVDVSRPDLPLRAAVDHVHAAGVRVLATGVRDAAAEAVCWAAGVDAVRNAPPALGHTRRCAA